ncbi:MAG: class I SAM-dependent methyltransferase [Reyranellaceae bacterium]
MDRQPPDMPCRICGGLARLFDLCDFATYCHRPPGGPETLSGVPVYYYRCAACGFLFTPLTDNWSADDFRRRIYNEEYVRYDPGYAEERPRSNAEMLANFFGAHRQSLSLLDFGGGNGAMVDRLKAGGFAGAACYDPIAQPGAPAPTRPVDLVTCFEVLEHANDPMAVIRQLAGLCGGLVLFSTLLQPPDIETQRLRWWYAAPRNGHISLFSRPALTLAWRSVGMTLGSFNDNLHVAFRQVPAFAAHLFKR